MKFIDTAKFTIEAGKGGDGAVSFRHDLYVPNGGPNGGDGGNGGNVIFVGDSGKHSLLDLKLNKTFKAEDGGKGDIKNMHGAKGDNLIIRVPVGTVLINAENGEILADIDKADEEVIVAKGGKGGKGNARFANSRNKAPSLFEAGTLGEDFDIRAELKVLADVGFVGLPNAGKSTLLRAITNSKPEVADYPFTTLNPQLGVAKAPDGDTFVVADLPGLIEGASLGKGLGHEFLKHIERCKVICHVVDMSGNYGTEDVIANYETIRAELKDYNQHLDERPEIVVLNKMDTDEAQINMMDERIKEFFKDKNTVQVSGLKRENLKAFLADISETLKTTTYKPLWEVKDKYNGVKVYGFEDDKPEVIIQNKGNGRWEVSGKTIFDIYQRTPLWTDDNLLWFNEKLKNLGVYDQLREKGIQAGDLVKIFDYELEWVD
ncbi:GTPase ObgE [Mesoplasma lactucae]|uniref:GTPase Obg n=1 Tax=Mesoplasma lactucae ATCC 49193 TaxID=81460 RepID=A0A291IRK8_9MOLU|nr:GTPase ObgE [Mesoplasma lactucae]ATG97327.1 GTPase ObgE [Mesoplasma lactucae ATCC 49193]ATZ20222.1 GTPase ObgE [Mesoplasma lactucae ATCC 49193]MCL8216971.1 GTPase Obg [Mesoplasma lactucae ATCC 49193]